MGFPGDLPSPCEAQPPDTALDLQGLGQPPVRGGKYDRGRQRPHGEFGFGAGSKQPSDAGVKLARVDVACRVQILEELRGTVLGIILAHDLAFRVAAGPLGCSGTGRYQPI
jgi:hypothetical protein